MTTLKLYAWHPTSPELPFICIMAKDIETAEKEVRYWAADNDHYIGQFPDHYLLSIAGEEEVISEKVSVLCKKHLEQDAVDVFM